MPPSASAGFIPALVIVDWQVDFTTGSLAVQGGLDIAPTVNQLLALPFALRIATKDFHPKDHISFASNHPEPNNKPFESTITIKNPNNPSETETSRLWPDHCIQGTPGCELVSELDISKIDAVIEKGQDARVEMYSAFAPPFSDPRMADSGLAQNLRDAAITHVYVVGLAFDHCVRATAIDAAKEGFQTFVVEEGCRPVDSTKDSFKNTKSAFDAQGVAVVSADGPEVQLVRELTGR